MNDKYPIKNWLKRGLIKQNHSYTPEQLDRISDILSGKLVEPFAVLQSPKTSFRSIELFSGAGGMALGFENAGLNHSLLVEIDRNASKTLMVNRPDWNVVSEDVSTIDFSAYKGSVDVVSGGFPCQSFSYAGNKAGFEDTRGTLFFEFARCVSEVQPKVALGENVRGLLNHDKGRTLQVMTQSLRSLGYQVFVKLLHAQFMNVPQKRERVFIMAIRQDVFDSISSTVDPVFPQESPFVTTLRSALKDVPCSEGAQYPDKKRGIFAFVPEGGFWKDLPEPLQREYMGKSFYSGGGKTGMARRLAWDEPSLTLTCSPSQKQTERCHPSENRPLTIREYARIQTFPDEWVFSGSVSSQYRQIGNAVPVNMAFHVAARIVDILKADGDKKHEQ